MFEKVSSTLPHKFLRSDFNLETIHITAKEVKNVRSKLNIGFLISTTFSLSNPVFYFSFDLFIVT